MTREEIFNEEKRLRAEKKAKQESSKFNADRETPEWHALQPHFTQFRFLGYYPDARHGDPTAAKHIQMSMIMGDNQKKFRCIFPDQKERPDWIMWRIMNKVMDSRWDAANKQRIYKHAGSPMLTQMLTNGSNNTYDTGWYPKRVMVTNVIARDSMEWHRTNKKTLLLSKKMTPPKVEGQPPWYDIGIPSSTFDQIMTDLIEKVGDYEMYDVLMKRLADKPYYVVHHPDSRILYQSELSTFTFYPEMALQPLTEEEKSWERWNIDKLFPVTSYTKLNNNLGHTIMKIDAEFRTNFLEELRDLAAKEAAEWASVAGTASEEETEEDDSKVEAVADQMEREVVGITTPTSQPSTTQVAPVTRNTPAPVTRRAAAGSIVWPAWPGIEVMTPEEKAAVASITAEGTFIYKDIPGVNNNCICEDEQTCKFIAPDNFHVCPKCGLLFGTNGKYATDVPF